MESASQAAAQFEGWAIVEVMGHRRLAGMVTTKAFGSVVMFEVTAPEVPETETTLEQDQCFQGRLLGKGSRIASGRPRLAPMVGAASVYQLTPCSEEEALAANPLQSRVVEFVAPEGRKALVAVDTYEPRAEEEDDED